MTCRVGIKCFFAVLEIPVLSPRSRPSPYFPWPVENGLTMSFDEGQVCHEHWARPRSCGSPRPWIFLPRNNKVMCWSMVGKASLGMCVWENHVGPMRVFPFSVKRLLLLRLWQGQGSMYSVPTRHSKPTANVPVQKRTAVGTTSQPHDSAKTKSKNGK